jgi:FSR family fosmidomycin resistance protein-like MFS transporter
MAGGCYRIIAGATKGGGYAPAVRASIDKKAMSALSAGHLSTDLAQGSLPALLPYLKTEFGLTYTLAAGLVLCSTFASSIVQPLFGLLSDARGALWLLPLGTAVAGIGMALAAVAPTYALVLLAVMVAGFGVAAYHPEASKFASYASGAKRASGMSFFSVGGNVGFSLGPLVASGVIIAFGLNGGLLIMVPGLVVAAGLVLLLGYLAEFAPTVAEGKRVSAARGQPRALVLLLVIIGLRSVAHMGLFTFVPLYEISRGHSKAEGTFLLSLFLLAGAIGTLAGGPLADRFGRRRVLTASMAVSVPLIVAYTLMGGFAGDVALVAAGGAIIGTFGVTIVMSQEYMPGRLGMASGLSIGLAIGIGGVAALSLGAVADAVDLKTAVLATAIGPALSVILAFRLPPARPRTRVVEPEPVTAAV